MDAAQLKHQQDGGERPNARNGHQPLDVGNRSPAGNQLQVQPSDLLIQQAERRPAVFANRARLRAEGQGLQCSLAARAVNQLVPPGGCRLRRANRFLISVRSHTRLTRWRRSSRASLPAKEVVELGAGFLERLRTLLLPFLPLMEHIYAKDAPVPPPHAAEITLDWLAQCTNWTKERLEELAEALASRSPQIVLAGPPGTSKTWVAKHPARYVTGDREGAVRTVRLHPSYAYEQFIQGLRPVAGKGMIQFQLTDGIVLDLVKGMSSPEALHVLIIDEMNRANLPKVFGELMFKSQGTFLTQSLCELAPAGFRYHMIAYAKSVGLDRQRRI